MRAIHQATGPAQSGSEQSGTTGAATIDVPRPASPRIDWDALRTAGRACCCAARPVVIALIPPTPGREHRTDLLLCMHHFRVSRHALAVTGASVVDFDRRLVAPDAPCYLPAD